MGTRARLSPSRSRLCPWPLAAHAFLGLLRNWLRQPFPSGWRPLQRGRRDRLRRQEWDSNEVSAARRLADENDDSDGAAKDVIRRDEVSGAADDRGGDGGAMQVEVKHGVIVSSKTENVEHVMLPEKGRSCCTCSIL